MKQKCNKCSGSGKISFFKCDICKGRGEIEIAQVVNFDREIRCEDIFNAFNGENIDRVIIIAKSGDDILWDGNFDRAETFFYLNKIANELLEK